MATIDIGCPKCGKQSKGPDNLVGKKIRCKNCEHVFQVTAPTAAARKPATKVPDEAKTVPPKSVDEDDDMIDRKPLGMVEENLAARCPHCALPLDPPDAVICIHCGYHMRKRKREESKATYEITGGDYLLWHLPTVGSFIGILVWMGLDALCIWGFLQGERGGGGWADDWMVTAVFPPVCFSVWIVIISLFFSYRLGKVIWYRLRHFTPPEQTKKKKED
jgi:hypothetical protein